MEAEISYIYTQEEEYLSIHGNLLPPKYKLKPEQNPVWYMEMLDAFVIEIRERVVEYFLLVYWNLRDTVPKIIGQMLINNTADSMHWVLYDAINKDQMMITDWLSDPDYIV